MWNVHKLLAKYNWIMGSKPKHYLTFLKNVCQILVRNKGRRLYWDPKNSPVLYHRVLTHPKGRVPTFLSPLGHCFHDPRHWSWDKTLVCVKESLLTTNHDWNRCFLSFIPQGFFLPSVEHLHGYLQVWALWAYLKLRKNVALMHSLTRIAFITRNAFHFSWLL